MKTYILEYWRPIPFGPSLGEPERTSQRYGSLMVAEQAYRDALAYYQSRADEHWRKTSPPPTLYRCERILP